MAVAAHLGRRRHQVSGVRVGRVGEDVGGRALLDDAPGVHHGDPVGERGDHGEVVSDVQRRHAVPLGQGPDRLEHVGLGAHVETGGRLVEHDHRGPGGERHGQADSLLLTARQLMRVATEELWRRRQQHLGEHLDQPSPSFVVVGAEAVRFSTSSTCEPIRSAGFSAVPGSCGT